MMMNITTTAHHKACKQISNFNKIKSIDWRLFVILYDVVQTIWFIVHSVTFILTEGNLRHETNTCQHCHAIS